MYIINRVYKGRKFIGLDALASKPKAKKPQYIFIPRDEMKKYTYMQAKITSDNRVIANYGLGCRKIKDDKLRNKYK